MVCLGPCIFLSYEIWDLVANGFTRIVPLFNWNISSIVLIIAGAIVGIVSILVPQKKNNDSNEQPPLATDSPLDEEDKKC